MTKLNKFCKCFDISVNLVENDSDSMQFEIDDEFFIYFDKSTSFIYLQKVIYYPGTYEIPPECDFKDLFSGIDLNKVLVKLMEYYANVVLDNIAEDEYYSNYGEKENE